MINLCSLFSATTCLQVVNGQINLTCGGTPLNLDRAKICSATSTYLTTSVYVASAIGIPYSTYERIAMPFSSGVWLLFLLSLKISILLFCFYEEMKMRLSEHHRTTQRNFALGLDVINSTLGGALSDVTMRNGSRFGFIIWLFMSFVLRNLYSGLVFSFLQAQVNERPVDTIDRVIEFNYTIYASPATYNALYNTEPRLRKQ